MRVTIAAVGRLKPGCERDLFERYRDRATNAGRQVAIGPLESLETAESTRRSAGERRAEEGEALLSRLDPGSTLIALDEAGKCFDSRAFAHRLAKFRDDGTRDLACAIGGPDGHGAGVLDRAELVLAFGPMTLPHGLVRVVLAEQIYRAVTIIAGHPYHRE